MLHDADVSAIHSRTKFLSGQGRATRYINGELKLMALVATILSTVVVHGI